MNKVFLKYQILINTIVWLVSLSKYQSVIPYRAKFISNESFCFSIERTGLYNIKSAVDHYLRIEEVPIAVVNETKTAYIAKTVYISQTTKTTNETTTLNFFNWFDLFQSTLLITNNVYSHLHIESNRSSISLTNELTKEEYSQSFKPLIGLYNFSSGQITTLDLPYYFKKVDFAYMQNNILNIYTDGLLYKSLSHFVLYSLQYYGTIKLNVSGKLLVIMKKRCPRVCRTKRPINTENRDIYTSDTNNHIASEEIIKENGILKFHFVLSHRTINNNFVVKFDQDRIKKLEWILDVLNAPGYYYEIPASIVSMLIKVCNNQSHCLNIDNFKLKGKVTLFHRWDKELIALEQYNNKLIARHIGYINIINNLMFNKSALSDVAYTIELTVILKTCKNVDIFYPVQNGLFIRPSIYQDSICLIKESGKYDLQFTDVKKSVNIDINERRFGNEILKTANYSLIGLALKDKIGAYETLLIFREFDVQLFIEIGPGFTDKLVSLSSHEETIRLEYNGRIFVPKDEIVQIKTVNLETKEASSINITLTAFLYRVAYINVRTNGFTIEQGPFGLLGNQNPYLQIVITEIVYNSENVILTHNENYSMNLTLGLDCSY